MSPDVEYLTKEKYEALKLELKDLKTDKRSEIASDLEFAKSMGDLSENAEYHQAREAQAALEDRISQIENLLKNAEIISSKKSNTVDIGAKIKVKRTDTGTIKEYQLVGSEEADMSIGKISNRSPLGESLYGKKKGDKASFVAPSGNTITYEVVSVS